MSRGRNNNRTVKTLLNIEKALEMRRQGYTFTAIGKALGVSRQRAFVLVRDELQRRVEKNAESADVLRQLELERLDDALKVVTGILASSTPVKDEVKLQAVDRLIKITDQRAKLLGLQAPQKHEVTEELIYKVYERSSEFDPDSA